MRYDQRVLAELERILPWKRSNDFYAKRLGIKKDQVPDLIKIIKDKHVIREEAETANYIKNLEDVVLKFEEDVSRESAELIFNSPEEIKTLDELIEKCKIDTKVWEVTKYVQNYWGNKEHPQWQVKAWLNRKKEHQVFQDAFTMFLSTYKPSSKTIEAYKYGSRKNTGCLVINKQDSHLNKFDIEGKNNLEERCNEIIYKIKIILSQAAISNNLEKITYIIGSDEFNSEFTGATTKGTPQQNIHEYHDAFQKICDHEIALITMLLKSADTIDVVYVSGNHDEYVGWHLINWLKTYFREIGRINFDCSPRYRKYVSYGNSALMFNHGDAIKPAKLASIFPIEFRNSWSSHENFYIFTGDKHHEISHDFNGIKFYQIPAFSDAKSKWDDKHGYVCARGEVTAFLIDYTDGMTNIFKQYL